MRPYRAASRSPLRESIPQKVTSEPAVGNRQRPLLVRVAAMEFSQTIAGYIAGEDEQPRVCASISLMRFAELAVPTIPGFTAKAGTEQEVADGEIVGISLGKAMGAYEHLSGSADFRFAKKRDFISARPAAIAPTVTVTRKIRGPAADRFCTKQQQSQGGDLSARGLSLGALIDHASDSIRLAIESHPLVAEAYESALAGLRAFASGRLAVDECHHTALFVGIHLLVATLTYVAKETTAVVMEELCHGYDGLS
jgi:hypothetical protein